MDKNTILTKEQKVQTLQKEVEEATAMEMPSLQQNLPIVATLTTLGTLVEESLQDRHDHTTLENGTDKVCGVCITFKEPH